MLNSHPSNTLQPISQDFSKLIGTPYSEKDCWGIVLEFYKTVFGIQLNNYYNEVPESRDNAKSLIYSNMKDFDEVAGKKAFGDIMLIRLFGIESHIAVYLGGGKMLHTSERSGCVIESVHRWEKLVVGYYRVRSINDTVS